MYSSKILFLIWQIAVCCIALLAVISVAEPLRFLAIGDWGAGDDGQERVAMAMGNWSAERNPEFILSLGDNFYPVGVASVNDTQWDTKWRHVSIFLLVKQKSKSISLNSYQFNAGHFPVLKTDTVTESDHTAFHYDIIYHVHHPCCGMYVWPLCDHFWVTWQIWHGWSLFQIRGMNPCESSSMWRHVAKLDLHTAVVMYANI